MCTHELTTHSPESKIEAAVEIRLARWLVYFASGETWYHVGEFVAADASSAIERAVAVFGEASAYRAEEIPWDAAPLWKPGARTPDRGDSARV